MLLPVIANTYFKICILTKRLKSNKPQTKRPKSRGKKDWYNEMLI